MNLEELKKKKIDDLQQEMNQQIELQQQVEQLEIVAKKFMTQEAITRLNNLKLAHQEKAIKVIASIAQLAVSGQLNEKISDKQLKDILIKMDDKKEFNIKRI